MASSVQISVEQVGFDTSIQKALDKVTRGQGLKIPLDTKNITDFGNQLDRATQRVITLGTAFSVLATANRLIKDMVSSTIEVEKSLTSVNAIFKLTNDSLQKFSGNLFDISRETATSFSEVAKAATEFSRQGLSVAETQKAVRAALLLSRDANIDVEESVKALTSATNSFNKEALSRLQVANRLASVDAAFAVSSKDLAEALVRTGSAAADAGVSFNQFIGLVTAAQQISQRGGTAIAGALNTIFTRINRKDTLDALDSLGIAITDVRGQALPTIQVLQNFAVAYDKMTGSIKNQAAELVGGVRQLNTLKATLKDLASTGSVFGQVQNVIAQNSNEIERRNAARNQTLSAQFSQVGTTAQQIGSNIGSVGLAPAARGPLNTLINNPITQALEEANGSAESAGGKIAESLIKGLGASLIYGVGPLIAKVLVSVSSQVASNLFKDISTITGLNAQEKDRAAIEAQIVALYREGGVALQQQLQQMTSLAERAALVRSLLGGQGAAYAEVGAVAAEVQALGGVSRRRVPGSAGGYIPFGAEAAAISAGVGGAPANARPVYLPDFNRGGGQMGIVANTSEFRVPGAAGGAIFNRDMIQKYGLPPGSTPIAAGGFNNISGLPLQLGSEYGLKLPAQDVSKLKELFDSLSKAVTVAQGSQFGPQIIDIAHSLDSVSKEGILKEVANTFNGLLAVNPKINRSSDKRLSPQEIAAYEALREPSARSGGYTPFGGIASVTNPPPFVSSTSGQSDTDRIKAVYRQQVVEENRIQRQKDIIDQNNRLEQLQQKLKQARNPDPYDPNFIGPRAPVGYTPSYSSPSISRESSVYYSPRVTSQGPSLYSRASRGAGTLKGSLLLGLGLPAIGGILPEGESGTSSGQALGAAKSALNFAGTGATIGSLFGPEGTLPGALIGAAIGGLTGAISKSSKSFEELSADLDQKNKKLGEDLNNALEVFRIQDDLKDALISGNTQQIRDLQEERKIQLAKVKDPHYLDILNNRLNDPNAKFDLARTGNTTLAANSLQAQLTASFAPANTNIESYFGIQGGLTTSKEDAAAKNAIVNVISKLSPKELTDLRRKTIKNPDSALSQVAGLAGFTGDDRQQFLGQSRNTGFVSSTILDAIKYVLLSAGKDNGLEKQDADFAAKSKQLIALSARYTANAGLSTISATGDRQIGQARNQIILGSSGLTDVGRLGAQRNIELQDIASNASFQRSSQLDVGKAELFKILGTQKAPVQQSSIDFIDNIKSLSGLKDFRTTLNTTSGKGQFQNVNNTAFDEALNKLILTLQETDDTEKKNIEVAKVTNDLLQRQLDNSRTFGGGVQDVTGNNAKASIALAAAVNRNDPQSVINSAALAKKLADIESVRRFQPFGLGENRANTDILTAQQQFSLESKKSAFQASQDQGSAFRVGQGIESNDLTLKENLQAAQDTLKIAVRRGDEEASINQLRTQSQDLSLEDRFRNTNTLSEGDLRLSRLQNRANTARNSRFTTSGDVSSTSFVLAKEQGQQGNAQGSFTGGFHSVFAGATKDLKDFSDVGKQVADSLQNSFANAFGNFVTGAQKGKDAFKSFITSVLAESARAFATKAVVSLIGYFLGSYGSAGAASATAGASSAGGGASNFFSATGGPIGRASGGLIPTMLTGGEVVIPPPQAARIGGRMLNALNTGSMRGFAPGGLVRGGSGVKDDVFQPLAAGSYVIRKSMVERYGANNLTSLAIGGYPDANDYTGGGMLGLAGGGAVSSAMSSPSPMGVSSGGGGGNFNIGVTIHDNSTTSESSSSSTKAGNSLSDRQLGETLTRRIKQVTIQTIQEQQRGGGILRPQSNMFPS